LQGSPIHSSLIISLTYHYDSLVDYVRRNFLGHQHYDQHFAKQVVHDVCIALINNPPQQNIQTPLAFLRLAAKNRAIDICRGERVANRYIDYVANVPDSHADYRDGENVLDFSQKLEALKRIIEALPSRQRQVFLLHRLHGMPQVEIAVEIGISRNMVTQHFKRAISTITLQWQVYLLL
jgi:RNA polymerase sigma-70 factor (ECF subfamily)